MWDISIFLEANAWIALITLTAMELVLGIDNIVFISILSEKLPQHQKSSARRVGLCLALITRLGLLLAISWVMGLTDVLFEIGDHAISGRDLILLGGGMFLIGKSTHEMFEKLEAEGEQDSAGRPTTSYVATIVQIMFLDIVFSLDSVITAVGMAQDLVVMILAMIVAVIIMLLAATAVSEFISRRPSMVILALSFLLLIGVMLMAQGLGQHVDKGYIYFAMGFSLFVEVINMRLHKRQKPVELHGRASDPGYGEAR